MNVANNRKGVGLFWSCVVALLVAVLLGFEVGVLVGQYLGR